MVAAHEESGKRCSAVEHQEGRTHQASTEGLANTQPPRQQEHRQTRPCVRHIHYTMRQPPCPPTLLPPSHPACTPTVPSMHTAHTLDSSSGARSATAAPAAAPCARADNCMHAAVHARAKTKRVCGHSKDPSAPHLIGVQACLICQASSPNTDIHFHAYSTHYTQQQHHAPAPTLLVCRRASCVRLSDTTCSSSRALLSRRSFSRCMAARRCVSCATCCSFCRMRSCKRRREGKRHTHAQLQSARQPSCSSHAAD